MDKTIKKFLTSVLLSLAVVLSFSSCNLKTEDDLYYRYDMNEYISVGEYSLSVDSGSEELEEYRYTFLKQYFYETLSYTAQEGTVEKWDTVKINYMCTLNGEFVDEASEHGYEITIGADDFAIDGFEEKLIGAKIGYSTSIEITMPEDSVITKIAGKEVVFDVQVESAVKYKTPDDKAAQDAGFKNLEYYDNAQEDFAISTALFNRIYDAVEINDCPQKETEALLNSLLSYYERQYAEEGMTLTDIAASYNMSLDEYKATLTEAIQKSYTNMPRDLVSYWILAKYGEELTQKDVSQTRTEIIAEIDSTLIEAGYSDIEIQRRSAYEKALKVLLKNAEVK